MLAGEVSALVSGRGAALVDRIERLSDENLAGGHRYLHEFCAGTVRDTLRPALKRGESVIVEGTQGFGLSNLQSPDYPKATSRDTTAATL